LNHIHHLADKPLANRILPVKVQFSTNSTH
jgi:hypothetical protein